MRGVIPWFKGLQAYKGLGEGSRWVRRFFLRGPAFSSGAEGPFTDFNLEAVLLAFVKVAAEQSNRMTTCKIVQDRVHP